MHPIPVITDPFDTADQAIIAAFGKAHGLRLTREQVEAIAPLSPSRVIHSHRLRQAARDAHRVLVTVRADESGLWRHLDHQQPLLLRLPRSPDRVQPSILAIPIAWDQAQGTIEYMDGHAIIHSLPASDFFARRAPLQQAALGLLKPSEIPQINPSHDHWLLLADYWFQRGSFRRARSIYRRLLAASGQPDAEAWIGLGNILVRQRRYAAAIPAFQAALELDPEHPRALNNLAYAMWHANGDLNRALQLAQRSIQIEPDNPLYLETIGGIYLKQGDPVQAAAYLEAATARAENHPPEIQIAILDQLIRAWRAADRPDLARQNVDYRQKAFPHSPLPREFR